MSIWQGQFRPLTGGVYLLCLSCVSPGPGLKIIPSHRPQCCLGKYLHFWPLTAPLTPQLFPWQKSFCWNATSEAQSGSERLTTSQLFIVRIPLAPCFTSLTINISLDWEVNRETNCEKCPSITTQSVRPPALLPSLPAPDWSHAKTSSDVSHTTDCRDTAGSLLRHGLRLFGKIDIKDIDLYQSAFTPLKL